MSRDLVVRVNVVPKGLVRRWEVLSENRVVRWGGELVIGVGNCISRWKENEGRIRIVHQNIY